MSSDYTNTTHSEWCPDCGSEVAFIDTQPAGLAQFFCEQCRHRRNCFVGGD